MIELDFSSIETNKYYDCCLCLFPSPGYIDESCLLKAMPFHLGKFRERGSKMMFKHILPTNSTGFLYVELRKSDMGPKLKISYNVTPLRNIKKNECERVGF